MQTFKLDLPVGGTVTGRFSFPPAATKPAYLPLIVCVPGGSYDAEYFDVDTNYSIFSVSSSIGIPVIALDRPGYGDSTAAPAREGETYAEAQGKYINATILPSLWKEFGKRSGATAIVVMAHSIGAMMATISVGCYNGDEGYPLGGLITSGIGSELAEGPRQAMLQLLSGKTESIHFDPPTKDAIMLQWPIQNVVEPGMCKHTEKLNKPVPPQELYDINVNWLGYWRRYSDKVAVPLMYGLSEFDALWASSENTVESYRQAFPTSPRVNCGIVPFAPHCIELSLQSKAWYLKCCGFALECAVSHGLGVRSRDEGQGGKE